jgi:shikimate kinase
MIQQRRKRGPIFLVGFMGCGKSAVGREISRHSDRVFVDLDEEIVRVARQTIADLIRSQGEVEFRRIESSCLNGIASRNGVVVATGGGVVLDEKNRELMSRSGVTVWIDAPFDLCWQRIEIDRTVRPLAPDRETALLKFNERQEFYQQSDIHIAIDESMTSTTIAELILDRLP